MLSLADVRVRYGPHTVLDGISTQVPAGRIVGLIGPNGTGKSTLIRAIAGLLSCEGQVRWRGRPVRLDEIGFMPQNCQVRADLSVIETVLLGHHERLRWRVSAPVVAAAAQMLEDFGIAHLHDRNMNRLSGGQQQLVLLAQRMLRQPGLLLLDEATSALDIRHQMQVFERLNAYVRRTGALVMIAIHDLNLAAQHTQHVLLLDRGKLAGHGPFAEVVNTESLRQVYGIETEILTSPSRRTAIVPVCPCAR